jgi:hypothetical protein
VWVRANCGSTGFGEYSDNFYVTTGAVVACLPPTTFPAVTYAAGANNLADATLSWSGATGTSGSPAYEVHLMLPDGATIHSRTTNATSTVWAGMSGNQTYQYRVRTFCANGNASSFSAWQPFSVPNTYSNCGVMITSLTATNTSSWGARLEWTPAQANNAPEPNGRSYWVQYWNTTTPNTLYTIPQDSSKIQLLVGLHQGLVSGQSYGYRVWYLCNGGLQNYLTAATSFQLATPMADKTQIGASLGVQEDTNTLLIYPNPAKQVAVISYQSAVTSQQPIELTVIDALGRTIYTETTPSNHLQTTLNVSKSASGVYLVKVQDGGQTLTKKLVVE